MTEHQQHELEADQIAFHVVGRRAGEREKVLYSQAMGILKPSLNERETVLWESMLRSRLRMAWADAGLALVRPSSVLRRKLLVMVAILEASPDFADQFLPRRLPPPPRRPSRRRRGGAERLPWDSRHSPGKILGRLMQPDYDTIVVGSGRDGSHGSADPG